MPNENTKSDLLKTTLSVAVPLWIGRLRSKPMGYILERAQACGQEIAEHGDLILFRSKKKGQTAEAFNRLAEGLACMSFVPGGVMFLGVRWEAKRDRSEGL